jgi:hypothetical protein
LKACANCFKKIFLIKNDFFKSRAHEDIPIASSVFLSVQNVEKSDCFGFIHFFRFPPKPAASQTLSGKIHELTTTQEKKIVSEGH